MSLSIASFLSGPARDGRSRTTLLHPSAGGASIPGTMRRRTAMALLALTVLLATPVAAHAATAKAIAGFLDKRAVFAEETKPNVNWKRLERDLGQTPGVKIVAIAKLPSGAKNVKQAADKILALLKDKTATVIVVRNGKLGGASGSLTTERLEQLLVAARAEITASTKPVKAREELVSLAQAVAAAGAAGDESGSTTGSGGKAKDDGGRPWWQWLLLALILLALGGVGFVLYNRRARDRRQRRRGGSIWTARSFHSERLDALARRHGLLVGPVADRSDEDDELRELSEQAQGKLLVLRRSLPQLASPRELRTCSGELDQIEWLIECIEARVAGAEAPPRPTPERTALCFFTHEHGLATVDIDLRKPDGTVATVRVCPANARALANGEPPAVSRVHVAGREVPWPAAPTWYGAPGWSEDDLPGLEYEGREIWGRDLPQRLLPVDGPAGLDDDDDLPPGVTPPSGWGDPVAPPAALGSLGVPVAFGERPGLDDDDVTRAVEDGDVVDDVPSWATPAAGASDEAPAEPEADGDDAIEDAEVIADEASDDGAWSPPADDDGPLWAPLGDAEPEPAVAADAPADAADALPDAPALPDMPEPPAEPAAIDSTVEASVDDVHAAAEALPYDELVDADIASRPAPAEDEPDQTAFWDPFADDDGARDER